MMSKMILLASAATVVSGHNGFYNPGMVGRADRLDSLCMGLASASNGCFCVWNENKGDGRCHVPGATNCGDVSGVKACLPNPDKKSESLGLRGSSIGPTSPTSTMTGGVIVENGDGWEDIQPSRFLNYPQSLLGRTALIPGAYTEGGYIVELDCVIGGEDNLCDLFVFMYRCPPCEFQNGGNLAVDLLASDWVPYTCDVKFQLDQAQNTFAHSTIVYHKQIPAGTYEDVIPNGMLELAWFAKSPATSHCSDYGTESMCVNELPGECEWKDNVCSRVLCPPPTKLPHPANGVGAGGSPKGPWEPKCTFCLEAERATFMPTLL